MHSYVTQMLKGLNTNKAQTKVTILGCRETSDVSDPVSDYSYVGQNQVQPLSF